MFIEDTCEKCGSKEDLHLHHVYPFNNILEDSLVALGLQHYSSVNDYTPKEVDNLINQVLGMEMRVDYLTLCFDCHVLEHQMMSPIKSKYRQNKKGESNKVPVYQICVNTFEIIEEYSSTINAALHLEINSGHISSACSNKTMRAGGYYWCRKEDYHNSRYKIKIPKKYINKALTTKDKANLVESVKGDEVDMTWNGLKRIISNNGYTIKEHTKNINKKRHRVSTIRRVE